ncbi:MAG: aryl-sulfate sulfotransferase [bacterium]
MKAKYLTIGLCIVVLSLFALSSVSTAQEIGKGPGKSVEAAWPTGVTVYDATRAYPGFTLFVSLGGDGTHYLIDMKGKVVHTWKLPECHYGWLLENGNLFTGISRKVGGLGTAATKTPSTANVGAVVEVDWNGNIVNKWEHNAIHHDYDKLPNGNAILILWSKHRNPNKMKGGIPRTEYPGGVVLSETVVEMTPEGKIVWKWVADDHLKPEEYPVCPLDYRQRWLHLNSLQYIPGDNPIFPGKELLFISLRQPSTGIIVDKATGEVLIRYGGYIDGEWGRLGHPHSFYMIGAKRGADFKGKNLPGYGNILVFDNGMHIAGYADWGLPRSSVTEIDPKTKKVVWAYRHTEDFKGWMAPEWKFSSPYIAGAQRLPNGNTLICDGAVGRICEVTKDREIVWEYINPERKAIFRAYRYGPDFPGFAGKDLPRP